MVWSKREKSGAVWTALATIAVIVASIAYLWLKTRGWEGVTNWAFLKIAVVITLVFASIGGVMAFFIVMVIRKNDGFESRE